MYGLRLQWKPMPVTRLSAVRHGSSRYVARMGYQTLGARAESRAAGDASAAATVRLAVGRYAPRLEWRRLGGTSLGELSLARHGAPALCGQVFDGHAVDRAGAALALAEAAVLCRLNLENRETPQ